jgi:hypothetical protein
MLQLAVELKLWQIFLEPDHDSYMYRKSGLLCQLLSLTCSKHV